MLTFMNTSSMVYTTEDVRVWVQDLFANGLGALNYHECVICMPNITLDDWLNATDDYFRSATGITVFNQKIK